MHVIRGRPPSFTWHSSPCALSIRLAGERLFAHADVTGCHQGRHAALYCTSCGRSCSDVQLGLFYQIGHVSLACSLASACSEQRLRFRLICCCSICHWQDCRCAELQLANPDHLSDIIPGSSTKLRAVGGHFIAAAKFELHDSMPLGC